MSNEPPPIKVKLRKGTHSCWECKRRKMKCITDPVGEANVCRGCERRKTPCIRQEYPEDNRKKSQRKLNQQRYQSASGGSTGVVNSPLPTLPSPNTQQLHDVIVESNSANEVEDLSKILLQSLPRRQDIEALCKVAGPEGYLSRGILTRPYIDLETPTLSISEDLLSIPESSSHPVILARYMLQLVIHIQHAHFGHHREELRLLKDPITTMKHIIKLTTSLVTTNDDFNDIVEVIECILLQCLYYTGMGDLQRAWTANRRAMTMAQLMRLDRTGGFARKFKFLDSSSKCDPSHMWFRIVELDRYLCLILGLSQGSTDQSMASPSALVNYTPIGRLERIHCKISGILLERDKSRSSEFDQNLTAALNSELEQAARDMPSEWWLVPPLSDFKESIRVFWAIRDIFSQLFHYSLVNQLYLPQFLKSLSTKEDPHWNHASIICATSTREILSRFMALRRIADFAHSCRAIDILSLMAAMTLLLTHISSQRSHHGSTFSHLYASDRAMIECILQSMEKLNAINSDHLSASSVHLLRKLLQVDGASSVTTGSRNVIEKEVIVEDLEDASIETGYSAIEDDLYTRAVIPYFGIISINPSNQQKICKNSSVNSDPWDFLFLDAEYQVADTLFPQQESNLLFK